MKIYCICYDNFMNFYPSFYTGMCAINISDNLEKTDKTKIKKLRLGDMMIAYNSASNERGNGKDKCEAKGIVGFGIISKLPDPDVDKCDYGWTMLDSERDWYLPFKVEWFNTLNPNKVMTKKILESKLGKKINMIDLCVSRTSAFTSIKDELSDEIIEILCDFFVD